MTHAYDPNTHKPKAGGLLACDTQQAQAHLIKEQYLYTKGQTKQKSER